MLRRDAETQEGQGKHPTSSSQGRRFKVEGLRQEARGGYAGRRSGGVLRLGQPRSGGRRRWFAGSGFCRFVDVHGWRERQRTAALHNLAGERRPAVA